MSKQGKFCFVDGLTGLFTDETHPKDKTLKSAGVRDMQHEIEAALGDLRAATKILILDAPDAVLAATEATSTSFSNLLLNLRAVSGLSFVDVHNTKLTNSSGVMLRL